MEEYMKRAINMEEYMKRGISEDENDYVDLSPLLSECPILGCSSKLLIVDEYFDRECNKQNFNELKNYINAMRFYYKALEESDNGFLELCKEGLLCHNSGNYDKAIKCYEKASKIYPKNAEVSVNIGHISSILKNYKEALEHYKKAFEINPEYCNIEEYIKNTKKKLK